MQPDGLRWIATTGFVLALFFSDEVLIAFMAAAALFALADIQDRLLQDSRNKKKEDIESN